MLFIIFFWYDRCSLKKKTEVLSRKKLQNLVYDISLPSLLLESRVNSLSESCLTKFKMLINLKAFDLGGFCVTGRQRWHNDSALSR